MRPIAFAVALLTCSCSETLRTDREIPKVAMTGTAATSADAPKVEPKKAESPPAPKVEPKELKEGDIVYNEKVSVRKYDTFSKALLDPVPNVWAVRSQKPAGLIFRVRATADNAHPSNGSLIIDAAGNEYTVDDVSGANLVLVKQTKTVEPKAP
jgi:hypothetical protein